MPPWSTLFKVTAALLIVTAAVLGIQAVIIPNTERTVVVYTSVDQVFSEPVLRRFQDATGIKVMAVYDVEAAKTTGLVNRLITEKDRPLCDVWWSGEVVQTILLKAEGILAPYQSPSAAGIPPQYVDPGWSWVGLGGRARVLLINTNVMTPDQVPDSILDLVKPKVPADKVGIAYPLFGTTATQAAALYAELGPVEAKSFFTGLRDAGVRVLDGNSVVKDLVANGQLAMGLVDTDDAIAVIEKGAPVRMVFLDQGAGGIGTLVIPNTVAMVKGAPHGEEAKLLIDYLLSEKVEGELVESGWFQMPLRPIAVKQAYFDALSVKGMSVGFDEVYANLEQAKKDITEIFVR